MATYSLSAVAFLWGGLPATGFGEGGAVEIAMKGETFTSVEGVGGEVVRCYTGSKLAEIKLTLLQTSPYNDVISALYNADVIASDLGQGGSGVLPFGLKDFNGTTLVTAPQMWVMTPTPVNRTNKQSDCVWTFHAANCRIFAGGQAA